MQFEGDKDLPLPPKEAFAKLSDARFLAECIPGREAIVRAEPHEAVVVQRPPFAFVGGKLELTIRVLEATPDVIKLAQHAKGIGTTSDVESVVTLTPRDDGGTHLHWKAEVKNLGGLLKMVPTGLIRGAAQKTISDVWQEVEKRLK